MYTLSPHRTDLLRQDAEGIGDELKSCAAGSIVDRDVTAARMRVDVLFAIPLEASRSFVVAHGAG